MLEFAVDARTKAQKNASTTRITDYGEFDEHELLGDFRRVLEESEPSVDYGQVMPNVQQMGRFFSSLAAALQLAADGRLSPDAALRQAEANIRHE
jgi:maltose-binding protein MalE